MGSSRLISACLGNPPHDPSNEKNRSFSFRASLVKGPSLVKATGRRLLPQGERAGNPMNHPNTASCRRSGNQNFSRARSFASCPTR